MLIYLIESIRDYDTVYKIGHTRAKTAKRRTSELQTGNDGNLKIVHEFETKHGMLVEKALQNFYGHGNIRNEWFNLDISDVNSFMERCQKIEDNLTYLKEFDENRFKRL